MPSPIYPEVKTMIVGLPDILGDLDCQTRTWILGEGCHFADSFGETVNLPDDFGFFDKVNGNPELFPVPVHEQPESFVQNLVAISSMNCAMALDHTQLLIHPSGPEIVERAPKMKVLVEAHWPPLG